MGRYSASSNAPSSSYSAPSAHVRRGRFAMRDVDSTRTFLQNKPERNFRARPSLTLNRHLEMDLEKIYNAMEKGHKVCKLLLLKKWDPSYKKLSLNRDTQQIVLSKLENLSNARSVTSSKGTSTLDVRLVKEAHSLDFILNTVKIADRWKKDKDVQRFNPEMILVISFGSSFVLNHWIILCYETEESHNDFIAFAGSFFFKICSDTFLFMVEKIRFVSHRISTLVESKETCRLWNDGIFNLKREISETSHYLFVERWLRKQFHSIVNPDTSAITIKHMKPFVQTKLQCKVQSKQLQEVTEGEMGFESFVFAHNRLLNFENIFVMKFSEFGDEDHQIVSFNNFVKFINQMQGDEIGKCVEAASNFLRRYLRDVDLSRDVVEPHLTAEEFVDFLYSTENSIFNPTNREVIQDMTRPLTHYWIASSHNTYLTGDQLKSESSLEAYSRALLMGCRCIELDCWDGQRKTSGEFVDIVIYHGYTMTSKLNLRDVLFTIRHYAFKTSQYPVILSIEDNCSVPAQRKMAQDIKEILGDMLLTQPVSRDEWQLPSPEAMKNKIILKHKKLQLDESDSLLSHQSIDEEQDQDILSRECTKRGVLYLRDNTKHIWTRHIFLLFSDRLCYILEAVENEDLNGKEDNVSQADDESGVVSWQDSSDDSTLSVFGVRPEEMHVTEEWFHGKVGRDVAKDRLTEHADKGSGVFLVRESGTFIGDYTLSFLHNGNVNHCRIKTAMVGGDKKFYFFEPLKRDTLYELISYYTKHPIDAPSFKAYLLTPCPQPQPHLNEPWFSGEADKQRAEELLSTVREDGAFLIRYSSSDNNVFVLSLRVDGEFWHYRLKRDGRIFVVNQMVFENLNQIVEFYSDRDFVRGICLKYPINERNVGQYASNELSSVAPGCYMELRDLDKEMEVLSIKPFVGVNTDHLSFPAGVHINIIQKDADLWKGRYNGRVGWFPADCVQEKRNEDNVDTAMCYETIELAGCFVEKCESDRPFAFRISQSASPWNVHEYIVAAEAREEMDEWLITMHALTRTVNDKINLLRTKEKQLRIASELSSLVVYCQAVPFNVDFALQDPRTSFFEMCSFSESKHDKLLEKGLVLFNSRQLSRVYPQASRLTSTNFNPVSMWNSGCHMVALNYQTGDRAMQLNTGKFMANGRCGYVLKPQYLMDETFRLDHSAPSSSSDLASINASNGGITHMSSNLPVKGNFPICLTLQIISGRHLSRKDHTKGICSPFVEVEITGLACDSVVERTNTITSNGLNPIWQETFIFNIFRPEVALLRFLVEDGDFVGPKADPFIGQTVIPVDCIRSGYRSIPLLNQFSEPLELSALLVHIEMRAFDTVPKKSASLLSSSPATNFALESAMAFGGITTSIVNSIADSPLRNPHNLLQAGRLAGGAKASTSSLIGSDTTAPHTDIRVESPDDESASSAAENSGDVIARNLPLTLQLSTASTISTQTFASSRTSHPTGLDDQSSARSTSLDSNDSSLPITTISSSSSLSKKPSSNALRRIFRFGKN